MSIWSGLARPFPVARRAYSVFSPPGGGRYFNSAKLPKVVTQAKKGSVDATTSGDASSSAAAKEESTPSPSTSGPSLVAESSPLASISLPLLNALPQPVHPPLNPHEFKVHQFFALHRPLLTISQPTSLIFDSTLPFNIPPPPTNHVESSNTSMLDDPPEASLDADADAARQLARAFVVNRIGASLSWEDTLKRLGLDEAEGRAAEVSTAQAEYEAYMDSTKRKRRKKMKNHKLKKRRRLNRMRRGSGGK